MNSEAEDSEWVGVIARTGAQTLDTGVQTDVQGVSLNRKVIEKPRKLGGNNSQPKPKSTHKRYISENGIIECDTDTDTPLVC